MLRVRRAKFWMPKYPLSLNLLALLSGSFYGTADPDKKGRHDVRLDEGSKQEETKKTSRSPKRRRMRRKKRGREGGGGVPKWRSKQKDKISLCACTGAYGGPGQRIPSSRSHISRIPLSYFTAHPFPPSSLPSTLPESIRGSERIPNFLLSRFFGLPIFSARSFQSTVPLQCWKTSFELFIL